MDYLLIVVSAIFVQNILLAQYLGNCPFLGVSKQMETAIGMGAAVIFVMTFATVITWLVQSYLLAPLDIVYLQTIAFILIIAALVQFVEIFLKKTVEPLYRALGIFLPLITTNCAVFGVALLAVQKEYSFGQMVVFAFASGLGFALALVLFAGLRERFAISHIPTLVEGTAIGLVTAGLMSLIFLGFLGMT
jgi:electron transport complex protein RnfA